ncbi:MAG: ABC transporter permease [Acidobacteriota bacterium]|nr:ABC transporter permease [Acidobacteriota bacterium]
MKPRLLFALWALAVVGATLIHDPWLLAAAAAGALLAAGRRAPRVLARAALAVGPVVLAVGGGWWIARRLAGGSPWPVITLVAVRVLLIAVLTQVWLLRVDPLRAVAFSPTLTFLLTAAWSQWLVLRRLHGEMRAALTSRLLRPAGRTLLWRHAAAQAATVLERSLARAEQTTDAMRSRGFFDDPT